jgi:hypothetical protein
MLENDAQIVECNPGHSAVVAESVSDWVGQTGMTSDKEPFKFNLLPLSYEMDIDKIMLIYLFHVITSEANPGGPSISVCF